MANEIAPLSKFSSSSESDSSSFSDTNTVHNAEIKSSSISYHKPEAFKKNLKETSKNLDFNSSYDMNRTCLGQAVIFNNKKYDDRIPQLSNRNGSEEDVKRLIALLKDLGFVINKEDVFEDKTDIEAIEELEKIASRDIHKDSSCFFAVFLAHGESGKLLMRKRELNIHGHILDRFRGNVCEGLSGKPKIFLFQACRGRYVEDAVLGVECEVDMWKSSANAEPQQSKQTAIPSTVPNEKQIILPSGADFLLCHASSEGYVSHRFAGGKKLGSWFIQTFVDVIQKYKDAFKNGEVEEQDFLSLMTVVAAEVANIKVNQRIESKATQTKNKTANKKETATEESSTETANKITEEINNKADDKPGINSAFRSRVQIPSIASTLRKKIFFPKLTKLKQSEDESGSDSETNFNNTPANQQNCDASTKALSDEKVNAFENNSMQHLLKHKSGSAAEEKQEYLKNSAQFESEKTIASNKILQEAKVDEAGVTPVDEAELEKLSATVEQRAGSTNV